jgi:DNA-directed RNA polymerase subunit beta'
MAVHVPLSYEAQQEARHLMASSKNILKPGSGDIITTPKLDMILGIYWMTRIIDGEKGEGQYFADPNSAITAYDFGIVNFRAKIKIKGTDKEKYKPFGGEVFETSVGRLLFNSVFPEDFPYINYAVTMKEVSSLIEDLIIKYDIENVPVVLDKLKSLGFKYATRSGTTWSMSDLPLIPEKEGLIKKAREEAKVIEDNFDKGLLSTNERYRMIIEVWNKVKDSIEALIPGKLDVNGSISDLLVSKARGSTANLTQMSGMKGLIVNPKGQIIDFPIVPSYKEGLSPLEYFMTTHGSRKGLADTALNTAKAGYLTRKMVDVAQDIIITEEDCGDKDGRFYSSASKDFGVSLARGLDGKILTADIKGSDGKVMFKKGTLLSKRNAETIEKEGITEAWVRSPLTCLTVDGLCRMCYGLDMGRNRLVGIGEAVGVVAAQAIGEPGTQLTMRTFHQGGTAQAGGDITMGLPRVEEIFERREPKNGATLATISGTVIDVSHTDKEKIITILGDEDAKGSKGKEKEVTLEIPQLRTIIVAKGDHIEKGTAVTDGSVDLKEMFALAGRERTEDYIVAETSRVYETQGAAISRKHIEVIVRKMFSRRKIKNAGDTKFGIGEIVERGELIAENTKAADAGKLEAVGDVVLLGISDVALTSSSFLSAASFQNTTRILIEASLEGKVDLLRGLKENVIIGRLIPAGTGMGKGMFADMVKKEARKEVRPAETKARDDEALA